MTGEQRTAREAFAALLEDLSHADELYDDLPESRQGRIISTDISRFLEVRYRDTPAGQPRDLTPGWDLAWRYSQGRLRREIVNRNGRKVIGFMAGGWGAGKTYALDRLYAPGHPDFADLAWDGTLKETNWARAMIDLALVHGWRVQIAYVFRDIELAIYGAVERAKTEGRSVPLDGLAGNHRAVQRSMLRLIRRFRMNDRVAISLLHNTGIKGVIGKSIFVSEADLARKGPLHYTKCYEDYYAEAARQIQALNPAPG